MTTAEVVIIGGGVVGSSIAYHLRHGGFTGRVIVVERDDSYARASSSLAMGGIRQQFTTRPNVAMVQHSVRFYRGFDALLRGSGMSASIDFRQRGYLFLADGAAAPKLERRYTLMCQAGANVRRLPVDDIRTRLPGLFVDDLDFGILGPDDGYANPRAVLRGFRVMAVSTGVRYLTGEVTAVRRTARRVTGVVVGEDTIEAPVVVNAAGPFAGRVATLAGVEQPVVPVRQHLFRADLPHHWPYRFPMVIDPGGLHWRHDDAAGPGDPDRIVVAKTRHDEPSGENFQCEDFRWLADFYPDLVRRLPALRDVRLVEGWAGLYEMTPDHNPMLGEHPDLSGFFVANGFSGHGLMMAPATGTALSELIRTGESRTIDIGAFALDRFARGQPLLDEATI